VTRHYAGKIRAINVSPQPPGTKFARKDIPVSSEQNGIRCVNFELDKAGSFALILSLMRFLFSRSTHVDLRGDRRSKWISVSHRRKNQA
jgi:hypothetical protein